jgi:hypothetical protein
MAGTLTISTLSDGTNSTSSTNCIQGSAKAWGNFTQSGTTVTVQATYNISLITRTGTGAYTVNFTNALADNKYSVVFGARQAIAGYAGVDVQSASNFTMYGSSAGSYNDLTIGNFAVFR